MRVLTHAGTSASTKAQLLLKFSSFIPVKPFLKGVLVLETLCINPKTEEPEETIYASAGETECPGNYLNLARDFKIIVT